MLAVSSLKFGSSSAAIFVPEASASNSSSISVPPRRPLSPHKPSATSHTLSVEKPLGEGYLLDITTLNDSLEDVSSNTQTSFSSRASNFTLPYGIDPAIYGSFGDDPPNPDFVSLDLFHNSSNPTRSVPYVLKADDSVASLALRFDISQQAIRDVNEDYRLEGKRAGDVINLPWVPTVLGHEEFSTINHDATRLARLDMLPAEDGMIWPTSGQITSGFGWRGGRMHAGIDIAGPEGTPVVAAMSGRVVFSDWYYGYGYMIDIEHANGTVTRYAHASRLYVSVGEQVRQGQPIMAMGNTGRSTGPHLHFEVRQNDSALDPITFLPGSSPSQNLATT